MKKVICYVNQFFGGIGGEDKADQEPYIVEGVVANRAVAVEAEVPILVAKFEVQTIEEVGQRALAGVITVILIEDTIVVTIPQCILDGIVVSIIYLTEGVECVGLVTNLVHNHTGTTCTLRRATHIYCIVGVIGVGELCKLGLLVSTVEADTQVPILSTYGGDVE